MTSRRSIAFAGWFMSFDRRVLGSKPAQHLEHEVQVVRCGLCVSPILFVSFLVLSSKLIDRD